MADRFSSKDQLSLGDKVIVLAIGQIEVVVKLDVVPEEMVQVRLPDGNIKPFYYYELGPKQDKPGIRRDK